MRLSDYPRRDNPLGMDMDKRDSLSDKIRFVNMITKNRKNENKYQYVIKSKDVKEFIKKLKEITDIREWKAIRELAGPELTE